ncbi:hypothetical protein AB0953_16420 [Streptomyces sp. NPDC046866]|uniref:hypothetical protein n=1 Tax=Streptomyces sp. NPDC046866 TaxID=3154921 RepID=UPI00345150C1
MRRELAERAANLIPWLRRSDGTAAARLGSTWAWYDLAGSEILSEDTSTWGLRRPWLPIPMAATALTFTAGTWTTMYRGTWQVQNPVIFAEYSVAAPASTVAQARLVLDVGGTVTQLGSTTTASGTEVAASFTVDPIEHGLAHGDAGSLYIQVQRTSGAGTCTVSCFGLWSRSS